MIPVVAIIGRPNVGKSALFNRFLKKRRALVDATPGLTRDRLYGDIFWGGVHFKMVDTGGLQFDPKDKMSEAIATQVTKAMEEATVALMVCDAKTGPVPLDLQVASWIRPWGKPIILVANKVDVATPSASIHEFSSLGLGSPRPVSSLHGLRIGDLLDDIVAELKKSGQELSSEREAGPAPIRIGIIGRPNVGKSSFINRVLNEERALVDETPGTTRDPIDVQISHKGRAYFLTDTAGVRSKARLKTKIDALARIKSLEVIRGVDACLFLLDASVGMIKDDLKLLDEVVTAGKPFCLAINKWDLAKKGIDARQAASDIARRAPFVRFAPVLCMSAKTGYNVLPVLERTAELAAQASRQMTAEEKRRILESIRTDPKAPPALRNAHLFRVFQVKGMPPTFHLMARMKQGFRESDLSYLESIFRREMELEGMPIRIHLLT